MKTLFKILECIGIIALFLGGASMDDPSILSICLAFCGLGVAYAGWYLDEFYA